MKAIGRTDIPLGKGAKLYLMGLGLRGEWLDGKPNGYGICKYPD